MGFSTSKSMHRFIIGVILKKNISVINMDLALYWNITESYHLFRMISPLRRPIAPWPHRDRGSKIATPLSQDRPIDWNHVYSLECEVLGRDDATLVFVSKCSFSFEDLNANLGGLWWCYLPFHAVIHRSYSQSIAFAFFCT